MDGYGDRADDSMVFGQYVREARHAKGWTLRQCTDKAVSLGLLKTSSETVFRSIEAIPRARVQREVVDLVIAVLELDRREAYNVAGLSPLEA